MALFGVKATLLQLLLPITLLCTSCNANCLLEGAMGVGYRQDSLNWSIGSSTGHPNVLSELSWTDLKMIHYEAGCKSYTPWGTPMYLNGDYAHIFSGKNRDSDWNGDNKREEYSRSLNDAGKGEAFDLSASVGLKQFILFKQIHITPLIGWSYHAQHLRLYNGVQVINTINDFLGPFEGLHSNYRAKWNTPFLGALLSFDLFKQMKFTGAFEWHRGKFKGVGHWNLRDEFVDDFSMRASAYGTTIKTALEWTGVRGLTLALRGTYHNFHTNRGTEKNRILVDLLDSDQAFIGTMPFPLKQPLNGVNWHAACVYISVGLTEH